jgi:hypothetical protein
MRSPAMINCGEELSMKFFKVKNELGWNRTNGICDNWEMMMVSDEVNERRAD